MNGLGMSTAVESQTLFTSRYSRILSVGPSLPCRRRALECFCASAISAPELRSFKIGLTQILHHLVCVVFSRCGAKNDTHGEVKYHADGSLSRRSPS